LSSDLRTIPSGRWSGFRCRRLSHLGSQRVDGASVVALAVRSGSGRRNCTDDPPTRIRPGRTGAARAWTNGDIPCRSLRHTSRLQTRPATFRRRILVPRLVRHPGPGPGHVRWPGCRGGRVPRGRGCRVPRWPGVPGASVAGGTGGLGGRGCRGPRLMLRASPAGHICVVDLASAVDPGDDSRPNQPLKPNPPRQFPDSGTCERTTVPAELTGRVRHLGLSRSRGCRSRTAPGRTRDGANQTWPGPSSQLAG
jgi:hypothetical protein